MLVGTDISLTARAFLTLELLQDRPGITANKLADALGVSERADSSRRFYGEAKSSGGFCHASVIGDERTEISSHHLCRGEMDRI